MSTMRTERCSFHHETAKVRPERAACFNEQRWGRRGISHGLRRLLKVPPVICLLDTCVAHFILHSIGSDTEIKYNNFKM